MSILPRCVCGMSSYCMGGPLCGMPTGDDVPLFSVNYVNQLKEQIKELKRLLTDASNLIAMARYELGEDWDINDLEGQINKVI